MSESVRRRKYRYDRVLIESSRILNPQFDDAVVYLTGAQIEMLRNVSQYLNRLDTYVAEYNPGYYLTPTAADYDDLLEIVADLEETLMGNPNTLFGYKDTKNLANSDTVSGIGDRTLYSGPVPAGQVWRIEAFNASNEDTACSKIELMAGLPAGDSIVHRVLNPGVDELVSWNGMLTLKAPNNLLATFHDCADGDHISFDAHGYRMDIPT